MKSWFEVDRKGLRKLYEDKDKTFILRELIQNAFDENIRNCEIMISKLNPKTIKLKIMDDSPEGFRDISHAYTLFADTYKRLEPEKRGRFNIGEKLVFSLCDYVRLETTKGTIVFDGRGRHRVPYKTEKGSVITIFFKGTDKDFENLLEYANLILVPKRINLVVNGRKIKYQKPINSNLISLPTEYEIDGIIRKTVRGTSMEIYEKGEKAYLYEMGIPVCEIDCQFSVNIQQKVPLNMDRENVPYSYLEQIFAEVLNMTYNDIKPDNSSDIWVREACGNKRIEKDAIKSILVKRFGDKFCSSNPFDPISNDDALSNGYNLIRGREMNGKEWDNIRRDNLMQSSTELFGKDIVSSPKIEPNENQKITGDYAKRIAEKILGINIKVSFVNCREAINLASYGNRILTFNVARCPKGFFDQPISIQTTNIILHELGHEFGKHTEASYHDALTKLGSVLTFTALRNPDFFKEKI